MTTRTVSTAARDRRSVVATLIVMLAVPLTISLAHANATEDSSRTGDDAAVRQIVAGFSDGWNRHDARAMCASVAEDVEWVGWRGDVTEGRKEVEDNHTTLFGDLYKNTVTLGRVQVSSDDGVHGTVTFPVGHGTLTVNATKFTPSSSNSAGSSVNKLA